jgi:hypothetical protein
MRNVLIATPMYGGQCTGGYLEAIINLLVESQKHDDVHFAMLKVEHESLITRGRARCAQQFLKGPFTHLLFWDADLVVSPTDIMGLLATDKDVVGIACPQKRIDWERVVMQLSREVRKNMGLESPAALKALAARAKRWGAHIVVNSCSPALEEDDQRCAEVKNIGTGVMLIKRHVIEKLTEAHPERIFKGTSPQDKPGDMVPGLFETRIVDGDYESEDFAFCRLWREHGGKVHVWLPGSAKHIGRYTYEGSLMEELREVP